MQRVARKGGYKPKKSKPKAIPYSPPALNQVVRFGTTIRYQKTNASDAAVYIACLAKLICMATSATTGSVIYESIRMKRVSAWSAGVTNTGAGGFLIYNNAIALRFDDAAAPPFGQERRVTDIPTSTRGAYVTSKMTGLLACWIDVNTASTTAGQPIVRVSGPIGTVVDLKVSLQLMLSKSSAMNNLAGAGLTTRVIYFNYLDNSDTTAAAAGTQFLQAIVGSNSTSFV